MAMAVASTASVSRLHHAARHAWTIRGNVRRLLLHYDSGHLYLYTEVIGRVKAMSISTHHSTVSNIGRFSSFTRRTLALFVRHHKEKSVRLFSNGGRRHHSLFKHGTTIVYTHLISWIIIGIEGRVTIAKVGHCSRLDGMCVCVFREPLPSSTHQYTQL